MFFGYDSHTGRLDEWSQFAQESNSVGEKVFILAAYVLQRIHEGHMRWRKVSLFVAPTVDVLRITVFISRNLMYLVWDKA